MDPITHIPALLTSRYFSCGRRLLLLDYDGTLVPFARMPSEAVPSLELISLLRQLCEKATVYIVSGRDSVFLDQHLGQLPLGLVAEHGAMIRHHKGDWAEMQAITCSDWRMYVNSLFGEFTTLYPGSFVEQKKFSLAWHYRNADDTATAGAARLYAELAEKTMDYQVLKGNKVIEVRCAGINKGKAAQWIAAQKDYDFILAVGDDQTDEDMFRGLAGKQADVYTLKVGSDGLSCARFRLPSRTALWDLLCILVH